MIRLKPLPTSNTVHRRREPQSQHGATPDDESDDSFGPLTGPSILTDPANSPCSGLFKVTGRRNEILNPAIAHAHI